MPPNFFMLLAPSPPGLISTKSYPLLYVEFLSQAFGLAFLLAYWLKHGGYKDQVLQFHRL